MYLSGYERQRIAALLGDFLDTAPGVEQVVQFVFDQLEDSIDEAIDGAANDAYYSGRSDGWDSADYYKD